jgi:hypothetical protein
MLVHEVSVLVVILNAMRLLRRKHDHDTSTALAQALAGVRPLLLLPG